MVCLPLFVQVTQCYLMKPFFFEFPSAEGYEIRHINIIDLISG